MGALATAAWRAGSSIFDPVSDRLLRVRLKMHSGYVSLIVVYAPSNEDQSSSEQFYCDLQGVMSKVSRCDVAYCR